MSDNSAIEWTDATWNPVTGCTKVSPGCDHCYAETLAERFRGTPGHYYENGFDVQLRPAKLDQPLRWKRGRRIFVNSMSDLFHESIIVGGESGRGARPMYAAWARALRDQCTSAGVPFLFKQWGAWGPTSPIDDPNAVQIEPGMQLLGKKRAGRELDGRTWDEYPAAP